MIRFAENLNKMITAGLGGLLEPPRTGVAVSQYFRYPEASGPVVSFKTTIAAPIRILRVDMQPIQAGSGDPSPENIRPISGRDSVTVWRTGINAWDEDWEVGSISISTGTNESASNRIRSSGYIPVLPNTAYGHNISMYVYQYDANKNFLAPRIDSHTGTFTTRPETRYIRFITYSTYGTVYNYDISINYPSTDHEYHAYNGQSVTIQLGQTVYGGTLDVSTGKLTVTHGEIASYNGEVLTGEWISDRDVYAAGTTPTIGAQVVYVLDTPQTIDLDPQQITTLIGDNNVWSDAGNISLEYPYYEETEGY